MPQARRDNLLTFWRLKRCKMSKSLLESVTKSATRAWMHWTVNGLDPKHKALVRMRKCTSDLPVLKPSEMFAQHLGTGNFPLTWRMKHNYVGIIEIDLDLFLFHRKISLSVPKFGTFGDRRTPTRGEILKFAVALRARLSNAGKSSRLTAQGRDPDRRDLSRANDVGSGKKWYEDLVFANMKIARQNKATRFSKNSAVSRGPRSRNDH